MKTILTVLPLLILTSCFGLPTYPTCFKHPCVEIPGETKATDWQKSHAAADLLDVIRGRVPECRNPTIIKTKIINLKKQAQLEKRSGLLKLVQPNGKRHYFLGHMKHMELWGGVI